MVFELNEVQLRDVELSGLLAMDAANIETKPTPDLTKTGAFSFREPMSVEDRRLHTATTSPGGIPFEDWICLYAKKLMPEKKGKLKKLRNRLVIIFLKKNWKSAQI